MKMSKICVRCKIEHPIGTFRMTTEGYRISYCSICSRLNGKESYQRHKKQRNEKANQTYRANRKLIRIVAKASYEKHKEKRQSYMNEYYRENREERIIYARGKRKERAAYMRQKRKDDPNFRCASLLRSRIRKAVREKKYLDEILFGCSLDYLLQHIQYLFKEGMTWENIHLWEIDHIRPLSSFNLTDPKELKIATHYSNLQPLWTGDNRKKATK